MSGQHENNSVSSEKHKQAFLLRYFRIACSFRGEELRLQFQRNAVFTAAHAALVATLAATVRTSPIAGAALATFGFILGLLWVFYYSGSTYWVRYWEQKCASIDSQLEEIAPELRLFEDHPAGKRTRVPMKPVFFRGTLVSPHDALPAIRWLIYLFTVSWALTTAALWISVGVGWRLPSW